MQRNKTWAPLIAALLCLALPLSIADADLITFSFESDGGGGTNGGENLGPELDGITAAPTISATNNGITFVVSALDTDGVASPNPGATGIGVNGFGADSQTQIEATETLTIGFNFDTNVLSKVQLSSIDFGDIGDATDAADVTLPDGTMFQVFDDNDISGSGFSLGNNDVVSADSDFDLASGDTLTFGNTSDGEYRIQRITLHLTSAIPEPGSLAFLGLASLGMMARRRR